MSTGRQFSFGLFFLLAIFFVPFDASAALLYFDPDVSELSRGDITTIEMRIDVDEGECVNVVDAVVYFDPNIKLVDASRGDSILSVWLEPPVIDASQNKVSFAAGIPGGYCGRIAGDPGLTNNVITLMFRSPSLTIGAPNDASQARIWTSEQSQVLLNDGLGTKAQLILQDAYITLLEEAGLNQQDEWTERIANDDIIPSDFTITLSRDEQEGDPAFSGRYFITFNAVDKQSGIDHYEVMEEPFSEFYSFNWGRVGAPWITTESPYVLQDQSLNSTIRVKAVDKAGNERIVTLVPDEAQRSLSRDAVIFYTLLSVVLGILIALFVYALWKRREKLLATTEYNQDGNNAHDNS